MFQKHPKQKGVFLKFETSDIKLKEALLNKGLQLRAGICLLKLHHKHVEGEPDEANNSSAANLELGPTPNEAAGGAASAESSKIAT